MLELSRLSAILAGSKYPKELGLRNLLGCGRLSGWQSLPSAKIRGIQIKNENEGERLAATAPGSDIHAVIQ